VNKEPLIKKKKKSNIAKAINALERTRRDLRPDCSNGIGFTCVEYRYRTSSTITGNTSGIIYWVALLHGGTNACEVWYRGCC